MKRPMTGARAPKWLDLAPHCGRSSPPLRTCVAVRRSAEGVTNVRGCLVFGGMAQSSSGSAEGGRRLLDEPSGSAEGGRRLLDKRAEYWGRSASFGYSLSRMSEEGAR